MYTQIPTSFTQEVKFKALYPDVQMPKYAHDNDAGFDLIAYHFLEYHAFRANGTPFKDKIDPNAKSITLVPHSRLLVGCGFELEFPEGLMLEVKSRSGNALNLGLCMANGVGTIDSDYRGEMGILLLNSSDYPIEISIGDKVGQAILMPYYKASFIKVYELSETKRGKGGFGSTDTDSTYDPLGVEKRGYPSRDNAKL